MPSPPVRLHEVLTGWQLGAWTADVALVLQAAAVVLYLLGVRRLAARGRRWSRWRTMSFLAGVLVLVVAVPSGLASYDDKVFVVHVGQHLLLMMVAPPLLALGAPVTLALQAARRTTQSWLARLLRHPATSRVTAPLAVGCVYYASMYVTLDSSFYPWSLGHPLVHDVEHLVMFSLGCLFWWPIVATDQLPHRPGPGVRLGALFLGMPFEVFLGVALLGQRSPVAAEHTVADTHAGGALFWVAGMMLTFGAALVVLAQWMRQEERRAGRERGAAPARVAAGPSSGDRAWEDLWRARTGGQPPAIGVD
jgi:cytochrome c oxidase assembly factor CtaG